MVAKVQELSNIRVGIGGSSFVVVPQDSNPRNSKCGDGFEFGSEAFSKQTHVLFSHFNYRYPSSKQSLSSTRVCE